MRSSDTPTTPTKDTMINKEVLLTNVVLPRVHCIIFDGKIFVLSRISFSLALSSCKSKSACVEFFHSILERFHVRFLALQSIGVDLATWILAEAFSVGLRFIPITGRCLALDDGRSSCLKSTFFFVMLRVRIKSWG